MTSSHAFSRSQDHSVLDSEENLIHKQGSQVYSLLESYIKWIYSPVTFKYAGETAWKIDWESCSSSLDLHYVYHL